MEVYILLKILSSTCVRLFILVCVCNSALMFLSQTLYGDTYSVFVRTIFNRSLHKYIWHESKLPNDLQVTVRRTIFARLYIALGDLLLSSFQLPGPDHITPESGAATGLEHLEPKLLTSNSYTLTTCGTHVSSNAVAAIKILYTGII